MRDLDDLFEALKRSEFRSRFRLRGREAASLQQRGMDIILAHARDFVEQRLAPSEPANDGRQTPMRNHPVFVAQHATATCCRGCLEKWHGIPKGRALSDREVQYVVAVIRRWLCDQQNGGPPQSGCRGCVRKKRLPARSYGTMMVCDGLVVIG